MSLDVYLTVPGAAVPTGSGIFIRENGAQKEITRVEWDLRCPGREPVRVIQEATTDTVWHGNITHNLGKMAFEAGVAEVLWYPETLDITTAAELIWRLEKALLDLRREPDRFRKLNPDNGWGTYEGLVAFVEDYLSACRRWPSATVSVSR